MSGTTAIPYEAPASYMWREAYGGGWYLAHERARIGKGARVGKGAMIGEGAHIGTKAYIGEGAMIGAWTDIGERAVIGAGARIGALATIGGGAHIGERTMIGDWARIGVGADIGEGGRGYLHAVVLGYHADAYCRDGTPYLRYGCVTLPVAAWREQLGELCRRHAPGNVEEHERAIGGLLDYVEQVLETGTGNRKGGLR